MLTTKLLARLAAVVFALWVTSAVMGSDYDGPAHLDDIVWASTLIGTLVLIMLCLAVFARRLAKRAG